MWNNFVFSLFDVDISIKHNFEKKLKKKQTLFFSVVTTLFHLYLISLDL